jgi:hypothetical protein
MAFVHPITSSATLFLRLLSFRLNAREHFPRLLLREHPGFERSAN